MLVAPPALIVAEIGQHEGFGEEPTRPIRQRCPYAGIAEGDDIGLVVIVDVTDAPLMLLVAPGRIVAEIGDHELLGTKASVSR